MDFKALLLEFKRLLKPHGVFVTFADFNLLAELRSYKLFKSAYEIIWHKVAPVGFLDANVRPLRSHEFIGVFVDGLKKSTYNPQKTEGKAYRTKQGKDRKFHHYSNLKDEFRTENTGGRMPISVWNGFYDKERQNSSILTKSRHPTQKPLDLVKNLILTYSNKGDVILDPFMGSGTTMLAAQELNRNGIGCELHLDYFNIAQARIHALNATETPATPLSLVSPNNSTA